MNIVVKKIKLMGFFQKKAKGVALLEALILIMVIALFLGVMVTLTLLGLNISRQGTRQTHALDIAEAGINYYLWHLIHDPSDYCDGAACTAGPPYGPYVHDFYDNTGSKVGTFTIWITPPQGNNLVTVESRGDVEDGNENRILVAKLGIPSFAQYAVLANDTVNHIRFGADTEVFGPIHNNGGVRFDGIAHDLVSSALATYSDPDHPGADEPAVHTHQSDPSQVFLGGTAFPVPPVDFGQVTSDLNELRAKAQDDGMYYGSSGARGYRIILRTSDTFDIYRVNNVTSSCWGGTGLGWQSTDSITSQTLITSSVPFSANGVIFVEDDLWVDGRIDGANLTIASARLPDTPSTNTNVTINNDLTYTNYDGSDKIGVIAQRNIGPGLISEDDLRIDAALLAQNGRVGRNYFRRACNSTYYQRELITVYGAIATNRRYGFTWLCGNSWTEGDACDSGYQNRNIIYDQNLSANPPPSFPTIGNYAILDWREK